MEVGAVKQAFNNELILLKKNLNQAKIQTIHKLTRKAKTLTEKKAPEQLREKLKRKAESAVNEVLIIKKIKAKDIGKFMITHTGELNDYLNKPKVDQEKACARLVLHKAMQGKYKIIRGRFANVPIKDLFMSRQERIKLKKEAREQQKNKKNKGKNKIVNSEGDWNVEDVKNGGDQDMSEDNDDNENSDIELDCNENLNLEQDSNDDEIENDVSENEENSSDNDEKLTNVGKFVRLKPEEIDTKQVLKTVTVQKDSNKHVVSSMDSTKKPEKKHKDSKRSNENVHQNKLAKDKNEGVLHKLVERNHLEKKQKDSNKNKNFNDKILQRKFKKDTEDAPMLENKVIDSFFITSTGENYLSVAEARQPDEIKEIHKQGNRKERRAVMFGNIPKIKPRQENFEDNNKFNRHNGFDKGVKNKNNRFENSDRTGHDGRNSKFNDRNSRFNDGTSSFNDRKSNFNDRNINEEPKVEKLHPSWEAKKRQSGVLPFQGKKIVFDEN